MKIKVLVQKVNSGVTFTLVGKKFKRSSKTGRRTLGGTAIEKAQTLYRAEVGEAFVKYGMDGTGYAHDFEDRWYSNCTYEDYMVFVALEPWGFALVAEDGTVGMNDTGSTPTEGRAKLLACYQAPLEKVRVDESRCRFEKVYEVEA
jgi:hypothetical protein